MCLTASKYSSVVVCPKSGRRVVVSNVSHSVQVFLCRRLSQVWSSSRGERCVSQHPSIPLSSSVPSLVIESSVVVSDVSHSIQVFLCRRLSQVWSSSRGERCVSQHPSIPLSSSVPSLVIESSVVVSNVSHSVQVFLCHRLSQVWSLSLQ